MTFFIVQFLFSSSILKANGLEDADSLFAIGQHVAAKEIYVNNLKKGESGNPNLLLKLAFISEAEGKVTETLYYLSRLAKTNSSSQLYSKMESIAETNGLHGYEFNDFSYFTLFYKQFEDFLYAFVLIPFGYVTFEIVRKYRRQEYIRLKHKFILVILLVGVFIFFNVSFFFREGIVKSNPAYVRSDPSAAAGVVSTVSSGNKMVILANRDHWRLVIWDRKLVYMRQEDILDI